MPRDIQIFDDIYAVLRKGNGVVFLTQDIQLNIAKMRFMLLCRIVMANLLLMVILDYDRNKRVNNT